MAKKYYLLTICLFLFGLLMVAGSYSFWVWESQISQNKGIVFNTAKNLSEYVVYSSETGSFQGNINVGDDYRDGVHTTISLYKTSEVENIDLYATINQTVNQIGASMSSSSALKWTVTSGDSDAVNPSILSNGNFLGIEPEMNMELYPNIELTTTAQEFTIWIWIDVAENPPTSISGETLDVDLWTEISQFVTQDFTITEINANYNVITATAVNPNAYITNYTITRTNAAPSEWSDIASVAQGNIYNLTYTAPAFGIYYVWFKAADGKTVYRTIEVKEPEVENMYCHFGAFNPNKISEHNTSTIMLTCSNNGTTINTNNITTSDLILSNSSVASVVGIAKTQVPNGYTYTITLKAISEDGSITITLPAGIVVDTAGNENELVSSDSLLIVSDVYTITYKDMNNQPFSGTHGLNYVKNYVEGDSDILDAPTKSGFTFLGYFLESDCSGTAISSISPSYTGNKVLYAKWIDDIAPNGSVVLSQNGTTMSAEVAANDASGIVSYEYLLQTSNSCPTSGYTSINNPSYVFSNTEYVNETTYYACIRITDGAGNQKMFVSSPVDYIIKLTYTALAANYCCGSSCNCTDTNYLMCYTGNCSIVDDSNNNYRVKYLTSGNLKFKTSETVMLFLVGGGGGASCSGSAIGTTCAGGGGGYTSTNSEINIISETSYPIIIGEGGASATTEGTAGTNGGLTSAFGYSVNGGEAGNGSQGGAGGSGGGGGGAAGDANGGSNGADGNDPGTAGTKGLGQGTTTREFGIQGLTSTLYSGGGAGIFGKGGSGGGGDYSMGGTVNTGGGAGAKTCSTESNTSGGSGIAIIKNTSFETYTITYNYNGGTVASTNPTTYTPYYEAFTLNNPTKSGYRFVGWTGSNGTVPQVTVIIDSGSTGNRSYTANFVDDQPPTGTADLIELNGAINIYTSITDANGILSYEYLVQTGTTCPETGYTLTTSPNYTFTGIGYTNEALYACVRATDNEGNQATILSSPYIVLTYSNISNNYCCGSTCNCDTGNYLMCYTGTCSVIDDGNENYRVKFLSAGTYNARFGTSASIEEFLVGGGGGGTCAGLFISTTGAGGGGGYTATYTGVAIKGFTNYPIVIGSGGSSAVITGLPGSDGGTSSAFNHSVDGGGGAATKTGGEGGSGGGGPKGNGGSDGGDGTNSGGTGQGTTTREFGNSSATLYSGGGAGNKGTAGAGGGGAPKANGENNTGGGAGATSAGGTATTGGTGIVVIRNSPFQEYSISYELNGGIVESNFETYTAFYASFTLNNPVKEGYSFDGWTGSNGTTPQKNLTIPSGSLGDRTYVANWVDDLGPNGTIILTQDSGSSVTITSNVTDVSGIVSYKYNLSTTNTCPLLLGYTESTNSSYTFQSDLTAGTTYYACVKIEDGLGNKRTLISEPLIYYPTLTYEIISSDYLCTNISVGSAPYILEYEGECEIIDDGNTNFKVKLKNPGSHNLKIRTVNTIDAFLVGGGGGGADSTNINDLTSSGGAIHYYGGGGGGGGYTATYNNIIINTNNIYQIIVGYGGLPGINQKAGDGGETSAFGNTVNGGIGGGIGYEGDYSVLSGGAGGSGGANYHFYTPTIGGSNGSNAGGGTGQGTTTCEFGEQENGTSNCTCISSNWTDCLFSGGGGGGREDSNLYCTDASSSPGGGGATSMSGLANTGGGGGGGSNSNNAGSGGSGVVIIRNHR